MTKNRQATIMRRRLCCATMLAGAEPYEDAMRQSGQYGPRVEVPEDADAQTKFIAFIGRDPAWRPDSSAI